MPDLDSFLQGFNGRPTISKAMILCPSSLVGNWENEFYKWVGKHRICVQAANTGKIDQKINDFRYAANIKVLIISYESFRHHKDLFSFEIGILIADEGHRLKNQGSQITQAISELNCKRRIILSGTPLQNDLTELYCMLDVCVPGILGTRQEFKKKENAIMRGKEPGSTEKERERQIEMENDLHQRTNLMMIRRLAKDVLTKYLPPKVEHIVFCSMTSMQTRLYNKILDHYKEAKKSKGADALGHIRYLRNVVNHPNLVYSDAKPAVKTSIGKKKAANLPVVDLSSEFPANWGKLRYSAETSGKMQCLKELLIVIKENSNDRIVIVSNYTETLSAIEHVLKGIKGGHFCRLDGSVNSNKRTKMVNDFNDAGKEGFAMLLSSKAGGCGLNLIGANRLVLFDPDWNPANDRQVLARVWRQGQPFECFIYRFVACGTIEEQVYQRQCKKEDLQAVT